jgi:energy-coupling factor transporter ATP-binding protein EcfA2
MDKTGDPVHPEESERRSLGWPTGAALAVIGAPGTGKTTMLKHLALGLALERGTLPVFLLLRDHAEHIVDKPGITLPEIMSASLRRLREVEPPGWFDRQLQSGHRVVPLDGLDEVAREEDRRIVSKWVEEQIEQYESGAWPGSSAWVSRSWSVRDVSRRRDAGFVSVANPGSSRAATPAISCLRRGPRQGAVP